MGWTTESPRLRIFDAFVKRLGGKKITQTGHLPWPFSRPLVLLSVQSHTEGPEVSIREGVFRCRGDSPVRGVSSERVKDPVKEGSK